MKLIICEKMIIGEEIRVKGGYIFTEFLIFAGEVEKYFLKTLEK